MDVLSELCSHGVFGADGSLRPAAGIAVAHSFYGCNSKNRPVIMGNPGVIGSSAGLVPRNKLVVTGLASIRTQDPQDAPSFALVMGVHRHDKPLKFWLHNSCTNAPKQWRFAQKWGIVSERNLLIPNNSVWNREFAKPFSVENSGLNFRVVTIRKVPLSICSSCTYEAELRMRVRQQKFSWLHTSCTACGVFRTTLLSRRAKFYCSWA